MSNFVKVIVVLAALSDILSFVLTHKSTLLPNVTNAYAYVRCSIDKASCIKVSSTRSAFKSCKQVEIVFAKRQCDALSGAERIRCLLILPKPEGQCVNE